MKIFLRLISLLIFMFVLLIWLAGCDFGTAGLAIDRVGDFTADAPQPPYELNRKAEDFSDLPSELLLTAEQLAAIDGAAAAVGMAPDVVALTVEKELRALDSGELERDVVSALAGEDTSIGIAQVRVSTAEEIERLDLQGLFPPPEKTDEARTERIRRLAADGWSVLYAAAYLDILQGRHPADSPLDLAERYTGRTPGEPTESDQALLKTMTELFE